MTNHAPPRRAAVNALNRFVHVTSATEVMKLLFEQRPDCLLRDMTVHAQIAARVIDIVVMTNNAIFRHMIQMSK